jgi:hypothetical protein
LNALASDELIALIERKLAEHGISKVIPAEKVLAEAYRRMHRQAVIQAEIDKRVDDLDEDDIGIPTGLRHHIEKEIAANPTQSWDELLREIVDERAGSVSHDRRDESHPRNPAVMTRRSNRRTRIGGQFVAHRNDMLHSPAWCALSLSARGCSTVSKLN